MSVIAGLDGSEKSEGTATVIVSPPRRALVAVNPTVHVERAESVWGAPLNVTALGVDVAVSVTGVAFAATASLLVLTVSVDDPADEFVMPAIVRDAAVLGGRAHVPPLFTSVIVATAPAPVAVAEQLMKPAPSVIAGEGGTEKPDEKVVVIVSPLFSAPVELGVKLTDHLARARATSVVAPTVTAVGDVCAVIVTEPAFAGVASALVLTDSTDAAVVLVFVTPTIATDATALSASVQVPPKSASVTVAIVPAPETVAEQFVKPVSCAAVAVAALKPAENVTVMVSFTWSDPVALVVKFAVHAAILAAVSDVALTVTAVGVVAAATTGATPTVPALESVLVLTVQLAAAGEPAAPLVTPRI